MLLYVWLPYHSSAQPLPLQMSPLLSSASNGLQQRQSSGRFRMLCGKSNTGAGAGSHRSLRCLCKRQRCTASSSDLSRACSQATSELQISFEKLTPAALLLTHFNFRKESIIWHVTLSRLAAGFVHPSASTCATAWGARNTFYACLHQDTQVFPDLILRPVF